MPLREKPFSLLLALAIACPLALGMSACTDTAPKEQTNREDMLESAAIFDAVEFYETQDANEAKAKQEYGGKVFRRTGYVDEITTDYITLTDFIYGGYYNPLIIELPEDVIAGLSHEQEITVCGTFQYEEDPNISRLVDAFVVEEGQEQ